VRLLCAEVIFLLFSHSLLSPHLSLSLFISPRAAASGENVLNRFSSARKGGARRRKGRRGEREGGRRKAEGGETKAQARTKKRKKRVAFVDGRAGRRSGTEGLAPGKMVVGENKGETVRMKM